MIAKRQQARRFLLHPPCRCLPAALCLSMFSQSVSIAAPQDMSPPELQAIVNNYMSDKDGVLGAIVQIDIPGKQPLRAVYGFFDSARTRPIEANNKFLIGSITKTFTATLVLQLMEMDKVHLNGRLIDYLPPDWADVLSEVKYGADITVAHALCHRSGIYNVLSRETFIRYVIPDPTREWAPFEIIKMMPEAGEPHFKPGESFKYSNTNYLLLCGLVEHVAQKPYIESLQDNILSKLGLEDTSHSEGPFGSGRADVIHGYEILEGNLHDGQEFDSSWAVGGGAMISTTDDLITFMKALESGRLFQHRETFKQMIRGMGEEGSYGFGIEAVEESQFGPYYGHRGTFANTSSALRYFPKHGITICTCQTFDGSAERLTTDELLQVAMGELMGIKYVPRVGWAKDILDYTELDFSMEQVKPVEKYDVKRKVFRAHGETSKLVLLKLTGKTPREGRFQYSPSRVTLQYKMGAETLTTSCLALGMIFRTNEGAEEVWVTSAEESKRISRTAMNRDDHITIYTLFELPKEGEIAGVLFR